MNEPSEIFIKLLDKIHEMSMSTKDYEAVTGRCLKRFFMEFDDFEVQEHKRGTPRYEVVFSVVAACSMICSSIVLAAARPMHRREAADAAIEAFTSTINDMLSDGPLAKESKGVEGKDPRH